MLWLTVFRSHTSIRVDPSPFLRSFNVISLLISLERNYRSFFVSLGTGNKWNWNFQRSQCLSTCRSAMVDHFIKEEGNELLPKTAFKGLSTHQQKAICCSWIMEWNLTLCTTRPFALVDHVINFLWTPKQFTFGKWC